MFGGVDTHLHSPTPSSAKAQGGQETASEEEATRRGGGARWERQTAHGVARGDVWQGRGGGGGGGGRGGGCLCCGWSRKRRIDAGSHCQGGEPGQVAVWSLHLHQQRLQPGLSDVRNEKDQGEEQRWNQERANYALHSDHRWEETPCPIDGLVGSWLPQPWRDGGVQEQRGNDPGRRQPHRRLQPQDLLVAVLVVHVSVSRTRRLHQVAL
mmetsp:Transcript_72142/g.169772  ORF Transcript_72142/g.169772 Transcript_72142/m.169772 type:complete len:210 (+) Transcript_72142:318-947(+)